MAEVERFQKAKNFLISMRKLRNLDRSAKFDSYSIADLEEHFEKIPINVLVQMIRNFYGLVALKFILTLIIAAK